MNKMIKIGKMMMMMTKMNKMVKIGKMMMTKMNKMVKIEKENDDHHDDDDDDQRTTTTTKMMVKENEEEEEVVILVSFIDVFARFCYLCKRSSRSYNRVRDSNIKTFRSGTRSRP
ncbi:hypothetical protein M0804_009112 [Polistes exclamans]|nr:hypothetical protein M0804_009112 [Polistes exclamans]